MHDQTRIVTDWTLVNIAGAILAAMLLAGVSLGFWIAEQREVIPRPLFSLMVTALATAVITSVISRIGRVILRNQRMLLDRLTQAEARMFAPMGRVTVVQPRAEVDTEPIEVDPDGVAGLSPEMVAIARRTSDRLRKAKANGR